MRFGAITGSGMAVPETVVTNEDLARRVGVDPDWIVRRTGIRERRVAGAHETTSTLATRAAARALESARRTAADVDLVIVATTTPDRMCPATAPLVQDALGVRGAGAFDLNAACAGFTTALWTATGLIRAGAAECIVVVGAEVLTRFLDWSDPTTSVIFGDGAGAVVVEASEAPAGIVAANLDSDGSGHSLVRIPAGGSLLPASQASLESRAHYIHMNGPEVFRAALRTMTEGSERAMRDAGVTADEVDLFVFHQANQRIVDGCAERLGLPPGRVFSNVARYGNTSAASVPIALCEAWESGRLSLGSLVMLSAIGAGLTAASALVRWTAVRPKVSRPAGAGDGARAALAGARS